MGDKAETDVQETANLRNLAQRCVKNFTLISKQQGIEDEIVDSHWAARQSSEFIVWCTNIGVNGEGLRSIDLRLKNIPEISDLLRDLLNSLDCDLKELLQPTEAPTQPRKENESLDDRPSKSMFNDTIDRLHNHAQQIELAGARHRRERVDIYREKDGPKEVYEGFKRLASWRANENFKSASSIMIKLRIAESVARRRIRFEYLKEHQRKRRVILNYQTENLPQEPQVNPLGTTIAIPEAQREITQATKPQVSVKHGTILSATVNTRLDMKPDMNRPERVESVASVALRHPGFPQPPKVHRGKFQCPYCFLEFPARDALKDRWSQHVMHDFEPYFYILEECGAPFNLPTTFDGLMGHLQDYHPKKYHVAISDVEERDFNEVELEHYVKMNGELSEEDLTSLKKGSERRGVFLFTSCPFCGGYPDVLEKTFPDPMTEKAQIE
ncbi:hypothetical protein N7488_005085 [Penicillium malachiteum]|nr:hypothetical protein N7488_005085 [Penicillium malachiteum]